ncbi:sugar phosphate nucleotidyltransferase [Desulfococcus sp.]|uniref:sugar phosphate nucleotidyltransferase n=1 Tax=Desulfococcus sp. TaxID=2025834 RepID=UPI003593B1AC
MKALILAAGLGTRLMPYTRRVPKPLFTVGGRPLLDILIRRLAAAGCEAVVVNTHHLHERIEAFVSGQGYPIPVTTRYEPRILGTGGAIRNLADFWDRRPFMVVNSDILTDIDFADVYGRHLANGDPATLVLYDDPAFNTVAVSPDGRVTDFGGSDAGPLPGKRLTFSGIQVIDPEVIDHIPEGFSSSIDAYRRLLASGRQIRGLVAAQGRWSDLGTPERYRKACVEIMAAEAFARAGRGEGGEAPIETIALSGDGSDRRWYRLVSGGRSLVMADHGIHVEEGQGEAGAFEDIGRHLHGKNVAVPRIYAADRFSGLVFLEDLGDRRLQDAVRSAPGPGAVESLYRQVIDRLIPLWFDGRDGFDPRWTWQTERYDREMILNAECGYFRDAFLRGYLGMALPEDAFRDEFERIADGALEYGLTAFMHRDMQSRNIMMNGRGPHFIDFQGGRTGPVQYDLASLLIDPYAALPEALQERILAYCIDQLVKLTEIDSKDFAAGYRCCSLARNLQMLGAFGFLTRVKGKTGFEGHIPAAVQALSMNLAKAGPDKFPGLTRLAVDLNRRRQNGQKYG